MAQSGRSQTTRTPPRSGSKGRPSRAGSRPAAVPPPAGSMTGEAGPPVCTVTFCPICAVVTTVGDLRPEFAAHVMAAGREMLLALRSVIDARLQGIEEHAPRLERLTID